MAEATHELKGNTELAQRHAKSMADSANLGGLNLFYNPALHRKPERFVWVYSVVDPRPTPLMRENPPLIRKLRIPELKPGERYTTVTKLCDPFMQPDIDLNGNQIAEAHNGVRVAQDIVYPENLTLDQDFEVKPEQVFAQGNNYGNLGVFWSLNNPPTDEEIAKAVARKERYYRLKLEQARVLETSDPKLLNETLSIDHHVAADYFREEFAWHRTAKRPESCENCGEPVKQGAAFHRSVDGIICVRDWKRAVEAGVKKKEDVPDTKRWWKEEKVKA